MSGYEKRKGKNPSTKAARNGTTLQQLAERRRNRGGVDVADWGAASSECLARAVANVTQAGCSIQLGYTSDGGAYAIRLYDGSDATTDYVRPTEDIDLYLTALAEDFAKT